MKLKVLAIICPVFIALWSNAQCNANKKYNCVESQHLLISSNIFSKYNIHRIEQSNVMRAKQLVENSNKHPFLVEEEIQLSCSRRQRWIVVPNLNYRWWWAIYQSSGQNRSHFSNIYLLYSRHCSYKMQQVAI